MQLKPQTHRSLERALDVLLAFRPHNREMGTLEISEKLGIHKSTASRLLQVLALYHFIRKNPQTKKYTLGSSIIELGAALNSSLNGNLTQIAKPHLDQLRDELGQTVVLEVLSNGYTFIAYIAEGSGPIRVKGMVGDRRYAHAGAGAKVIFAFSRSDVREKTFMEKMEKFTPHTITEPEVLRKQFEKFRRQGFSIDNEEVNLGIRAVGAPVLNSEKDPVAAVVVAGLSQGIKLRGASSLVTRLKETAAKISELLYYPDVK